ncbi:uncharacterized protein MRAB57_5 [Mycobacterium rhizamassiliense]|jgi:hypothetical protein|uniref:Uncharacterized protein n=1 Tax=Mycobacterium rhizamassiliense TaxID=1841860 RepID=A0A2U3NKZ7_9MYCO|nr:hypothetical protein [Mycobacterium rhizamassiliense]SPM32208.1 uncharacterized protein MRAB57_5 [Mycobacterium rhizamassiliense]
MAHVDRAALQVLLTPLITSMGSRSHQDLDRTFTKLGLAEPPCPAGLPRSRAQRAHAVAAALADADLVEVAGRVLTEGEADRVAP